MMMSDLPPELVEEILSRVPATSLKRLRSSCKRWNTLFKDQRFAEKHFHKAPRESHVIMLKEFMFCPMNVDLNVVPLSVEFKDEVRLMDFHSKEQVYISDCYHCDGLLLCTTTDRRLVVWNPCVGETRWIQYNNSYGVCSTTFALGYANTKSGRNYKLMRCWLGDDETSNPVVETYEFRTDTWRVLDDVTLNQVPNDCVSINGNTYWVKSCFLFCFDFTKERVKRMCLPPLFLYPGLKVLSVIVGEEKLALLYQTHLMEYTWVSDKIDTDTEAEVTWGKFFTLDLSNRVPLPKHFVLDEEKKMALFCRELNELMVYTIGEEERCYASIPYKEKSRNTRNWPFIFSYVPSLVQIHQ